MRYIKIIFIILILILCTTHAYSAPTISSVSDDTPSQGQSIVVYSTDSTLGTHNLDIEWLGGSTGPIETGTPGDPFSHINWSISATDTTGQSPEYSVGQAYSGSQSVMSSWPVETQYNSILKYTNATTFDSIYATWWVYFSHVDSVGQWKQWRIRPIDEPGIGDVLGEIMHSGVFLANGIPENNYTLVFCNSTDPTGSTNFCYPPGTDAYETIKQPSGEWVRIEVIAVDSTLDTADGTIIVNQYRQNEAVEVARSEIANTITRLTGTSKWGIFALHNYWGNISVGSGTGEQAFIDDPYLQFGTVARVEVCDPSGENCEIQFPTAWDADQLTITVQSVLTGSAIVKVIDSNGGVSNGFPIVFAAGTNPVVTLPADKEATSPTSYTGSFTVEPSRTGTLPVSSNGFTVTCDDGDCTDEETEAFTVTGVTVPITDVITVTDSSLEEGFDSITITLPEAGSTPSTALNTGTLKQILNTGAPWVVGN